MSSGQPPQGGDSPPEIDVAAKVGPRVALVIGNDAYRLNPLRNPVNDAKTIAETLKRFGFRVVLRENLTQKEMQRSITDFGRKVRGGGTAVFYYAGHGIQLDGKNYLIPIDADIGREGDIRLETIDLDAVLDQVRGNSENVIILDACRDNPFQQRVRSVSPGLASIDAPLGTLIAYATAPGKVASDGAGANGLYTTELVKAIEKPGLRIEDIFKRTRAAVAQRSQNAQIPWELSSLLGDVYFTPAAKSRPGPSAPVAPTGRPGPVQECDETAGVSGPYIPREKIDTARAVPACHEAVALLPAVPRYMAQYARALSATGENDVEAIRWYRKASDSLDRSGQNGLGVFYRDARGDVHKDEREAARLFRLSAEQGFHLAQLNLGLLYAEGRGVPRDDAEAVRLYRLAADQGNAHAQSQLGFMYRNARGVPRDLAEALRWFKKSADAGDARGQSNLGAMYAQGLGVTRDDVEAVRLYRLAAEQGNAWAQSQLGFMYRNARGVPRDLAEALRWFKKSADAGNASGQANLGAMYAQGLEVTRDDVEAVRLYRLAAEQGNAWAQSQLGFMYRNARGVPRDLAEALRWFKKSADAGDASGQANLGAMYAQGLEVTRDDVEAVRLYRLAAEQGNAWAQSELGYMYREGRGIAQDDAEAVRLFRLAADVGHVRGQANLGWMYEHGRGVPKDVDEASRLYRLAAAQDNDVAKQGLSRVCATAPRPRNCPE